MRVPVSVIEFEDALLSLKKRNLIKQYLKAKNYLLDGRSWGLDFKERNPQWSNVWSFRINQQFRAFGYFDEDWNLIVTNINDHS